MSADSPFQSYLEGALATFEIEADEVERAVMTGVWKVYQEGMDLLLAADLNGVEPEQAPDLSKAPAR